MFEDIKFMDGMIEIRTARIDRFVTLGAYDRRITIDAKNETLTIRTRIFLSKSEVFLKFADLWYLDYEYEEVRTKDSTTDNYIASVVTRDNKKHKLFKMQGGKSSPFILGIRINSSDEEGCRDALNGIASMVGIPVGKPIPEEIETQLCPKCGRKISALGSKCLYCGGRLDGKP